MTKIRPLSDRIIVERLKAEEETKGGIIIPEVAKEKPVQGRVLAVGSGKILESGKVLPVDLNESDIVLFGKYAGTEIRIGDQELLIIKEEDILGVIDESIA